MKNVKRIIVYILSVAMVIPLIVQTVVWASSTPIDLILDENGAIRSGVDVNCNSSTMKGEYTNILDGDVNTFWFADVLPNNAPTYFMVDLGRKVKVSEIIYLPSNSWNANKAGEDDNGGYFRNGFDIQLSNDENFDTNVTVASVSYSTTLALGETKKVSLNAEENVYRYS